MSKLMLILVAIFLWLVAQACTSAYDVRHARWGLTEKQVRASEVGSPVAIEESLIYKDTMAGVPCSVQYVFEKGKLTKVTSNTPILDSKQSRLAFDSWYIALRKRYGRGALLVGVNSPGRADDWKAIDTIVNHFYENPRGKGVYIAFTSDPRTSAETYLGHAENAEKIGVIVGTAFISKSRYMGVTGGKSGQRPSLPEIDRR